jgi:RNA polymerase sigma-70 factor, ECF subfamily
MTAASAEPTSADFDRVYSSELPFVYSFLYRLGARGHDIEDLAHDIFVTAIRRWETYDVAKPVRPWLFGIAFRVMSDFRRRARTQREEPGEVPELPDEESAGERRVEQREARELIDEALESLEPERRAVFIMYELEGIPAADISDTMGAPLATTYSRLRIGREEFTAAVRRIQLRRGEA